MGATERQVWGQEKKEPKPKALEAPSGEENTRTLPRASVLTPAFHELRKGFSEGQAWEGRP